MMSVVHIGHKSTVHIHMSQVGTSRMEVDKMKKASSLSHLDTFAMDSP